MAEPQPATDRLAHLTASQQQAIRTVDRSVLVSAAAGSGKTTVLAERCVALVCDVPEDQRCNIDDLLVVTFTDAAADEMRSRIRAAIRQRCEESPGHEYLQRQLYLLESAGIGTIHAFCKTLIQRWFPQAGVDPQAIVLGGDEAELLRHETLDAFLAELYGRDDELAQSFRALVDDYGAGNDWVIGQSILELHNFINSLAHLEQWLKRVRRQVDVAEPDGLFAKLHTIQRERLLRELALQIEYCRHAAGTIRRCWPVAQMHADGIEAHGENLQRWYATLEAGSDEACEAVADAIRTFAFGRADRRPSKLSDEEKAAFDAAKEVRNRTKALFASRLQQSICGFTAEEYRDGLTCVAPHVAALTRLVTAFDDRYQDAKSRQQAIDFNDLQRYAFRLLTDTSDPSRPSDVARQLHKRYRYVLVDEFQDVDPLQEAILRFVSRETADLPEGNLFAVGDIKQSIYRFRLAEPALFADRAEAFASPSSIGTLIRLQENFRSRSSTIEAVNLIFQSLMSRAFGGSDYDTEAQLHAAADYPIEADVPLFTKPAVELHLLEPVTERTRVTDGDGNDEDNADDDTPSEELEGIEREAYLIGRRIQEWMGDHSERKHWHVVDRPATPDSPSVTRPMAYRDIVILLRALPHKAEPMADVLRRMGIPVLLDQVDSSMDSAEFRDCYSLLQLLDNRQQDIPLAAVLRSPLLDVPFAETELLQMRLLDRSVPFHEAVRRYVHEGTDVSLRDRLKLVMTKLDRYRTRMQREPVADVLWEIYEETHYLAYVSGLPDGVRRREHLVRLHELARQFGRFARQGLRRFLRFVEEMVAREQSPKQAATAAQAENAVRIMSVHASKGLEFPVVILADLQKPFNMSDVRSTVLLDRHYGMGLRAADAERRILYPTLIHQLVAERARRESLSEELRVLYVALTRAREYLVLVGRYPLAKVASYERRIDMPQTQSDAVPRLQLETASHLLDWLLPAMGAMSDGCVQWPGDRKRNEPALFKVDTYDRKTTDLWRIPPPAEPERASELARVAELAVLPEEERKLAMSPTAIQEADRVVQICRHDYPGLELTTMPARVAVSELKRRWETGFEPDDRVSWLDEHDPASQQIAKQVPGPVFVSDSHRSDAVQRGIATHRFLQLVDLSRPCDPDDLEQQYRALKEMGRLAVTEAPAVMLDGVAWFFGTELGQCIRNRVNDVRREIAFVSRAEPEHLDSLVAGRDHRDVVLVRGMVDLVLIDPDYLEILDYKTDTIAPAECETRVQAYRSQMEAYVAAMQSIYRRPVRKAWLVFLHGRCVSEITVA